MRGRWCRRHYGVQRTGCVLDKDALLTGQLLKLLALFLKNPGKSLSHDQIKEVVWSGTAGDQDEVIRRPLAELRRAPGDQPKRTGPPRYIQTERNAGYRFIEPVVPVEEGDAPSVDALPAKAQPSERSLAEKRPLAEVPSLWTRRALERRLPGTGRPS
jgi:DNA-binding winged helix-turn-helix (wHTH) protein